jgi:hypothetical protein
VFGFVERMSHDEVIIVKDIGIRTVVWPIPMTIGCYRVSSPSFMIGGGVFTSLVFSNGGGSLTSYGFTRV